MTKLACLVCFVMTLLVHVSSVQSGNQNCVREWTLVFRAVSGNGESVFNTWKRKSPSGDKCKFSTGCIREEVHDLGGFRTLPRKKHIRSPLIDKWTSLGVQRVKVVLSTKGKTVAFAEFDGEGSSRDDWFHYKRLIRSSWTDLSKQGCFNHFSINGGGSGRHFFINKNYGGCNKDAGWFIVKEKGGCAWDKQKSYPQFLYGRHGELVRWQSMDYGRADIMMVYISRK